MVVYVIQAARRLRGLSEVIYDGGVRHQTFLRWLVQQRRPL